MRPWEHDRCCGQTNSPSRAGRWRGWQLSPSTCSHLCSSRPSSVGSDARWPAGHSAATRCADPTCNATTNTRVTGFQGRCCQMDNRLCNWRQDPIQKAGYYGGWCMGDAVGRRRQGAVDKAECCWAWYCGEGRVMWWRQSAVREAGYCEGSRLLWGR